MKRGVSIRILTLPCLAAAIWLAGCRADQQPAELALRLEPGDRYRLVQAAHQDVRQSAAGRSFDVNQDIHCVLLIEVTGRREDGRHSLSAWWDSIALEVSSPGSHLAWDSRAGGETRDELRPLATLVGQKMSMTVSRRGVIEKIECPAGDPLIPEMEGIFCPFPEGPVRVGDSWQTERSKAASPGMSGLALRASSRWTLRARSGGTATISLAARIDALGPQRPGVEVSGTAKGTFLVDTATGRLLSGSLEQDVSARYTSGSAPAAVRTRSSIGMVCEAQQGAVETQSRLH